MLSPLATSVPVLDSLYARIEHDPDGQCLSDSDGRMTNEEFGIAVAGAARRLVGLGVEPGDVVAVLLPNRIDVIVAMYASWAAGATMTPINPALTDEEVRYQLADSDARVIVGERRAHSLASELRIGHFDVDAEGDTPQPASDTRAAAVTAEDPALIVYTSGTTGRPKGCVLTHSNIDSMSAAIVSACDLSEQDTSLLILPLFHCNGLVVGTVAPLRAGGNVHVADRFSPDSFWGNIEHVKPTYFSAVPTMYSLLADRGRTEHDLSSLRFAICGAAPMPAGLIASVESTFGIPVVEGYGLSECTVAATINPPAGPRKPGTVGIALPGIAIAIDTPDGPNDNPGHTGEVLVRGATVMRGYLGLPEITENTIRDGWLHTGDIGYLDGDGYLTLVDRLKDMIIRGGENIAPSEIEHVLQTHPDVLEAAVVGEPHAIYGEVPVAHVVARTGRAISVELLAAHCEMNLAKYKRPARIDVHDALPKNSVGKITKKDLLETR
ncbi:Tyrocidine synthase 3 [Rhodococcus sp. AW25M09]|uniref:class I adenylate-forming enzyme family protein n=1 Tax=Rhodococcus sp. AW25M09 TaxID=1268303 RepID=UPI0002ACFC28|nr:AMP-binding protein [Rhodococcus sp. AW25M09]CCQ13594.1 Tyrocidine synthase 3 [Rhodococcus sp. AW25M09]